MRGRLLRRWAGVSPRRRCLRARGTSHLRQRGRAHRCAGLWLPQYRRLGVPRPRDGQGVSRPRGQLDLCAQHGLHAEAGRRPQPRHQFRRARRRRRARRPWREAATGRRLFLYARATAGRPGRRGTIGGVARPRHRLLQHCRQVAQQALLARPRQRARSAPRPPELSTGRRAARVVGVARCGSANAAAGSGSVGSVGCGEGGRT
mmetsp:Transcript_23458/g.56169  ORF Transcript_23458/g.56169 Transcript_23458/m.56169 type:complete len:204 (-) Transcript_23458:147-758(-)